MSKIKIEEKGNVLHDAAVHLVQGMTTVPELKKNFSPGEIIRILSHAEKISSIKPKSTEDEFEAFFESDLTDPTFELFFEENYMPLVEAHPDQIYKYLDTAKRAFKELTQS